MRTPQIIQGGMGIAVSSWPLARAVSQCGQLGVVSGTALDAVFARRLQLGDPGGHLRFALDHFPLREMAERVWERYFVPGGKPLDRPFRAKPISTVNASRPLLELTVVANFAEVFLAKQDHDGLVGINLLEKIQLPTLPSLFGAMLAGVDYVLMGAGIPRAIPAALDRLAGLLPASLKVDVHGMPAGEEVTTEFDPSPFVSSNVGGLKRPKFLAIVSSAALALSLARKSAGVDGFVVEGKSAGGHNAPPRGAMRLDEGGEPIYGARDVPDLEEMRRIGLPFWLAGSYGEPGALRKAQAAGAEGVQVGTAFAFCEESGLDPEIRREVLARCVQGKARVFTDPYASPTGFPFKVLELPGTLSEASVYESRPRRCDLGYLRQAYRTEDGAIGFRCPAEPEEDYLRKGGTLEETQGRKCVCNGLMAAIGLGQRGRDDGREPALVTAGNDVAHLRRFLRPGEESYHARDVVRHLLEG